MIEFFSGVGGMRMAVELACQNAHPTRSPHQSALCSDHGDGASTTIVNRRGTGMSTVLEACYSYEIAANANKIYRYNFHDENDNSNNQKRFALHCKEIQRVAVDSLIEADLWTLSPPCQPFTRKGGAKHLDIADSRCVGLREGVMRLLTELCEATTTTSTDGDHEEDDSSSQHLQQQILLPSPPRWILLENVRGFEHSVMCNEWKEMLGKNGYTYKEYLLSPSSMEPYSTNIPNHRLRYYMIAERSSRFAAENGRIYTQLIRIPMTPTDGFENKEACQTVSRLRVGDYIEDQIEGIKALQVPDYVWEQPWAKELDIVEVNDDITHCFTSSYGRLYHPASGSLFRDTKLGSVVRRFSPKEVANFLHFPSAFQLPPDLPLERQYKHVCNAINVAIVAALLQELIFENAPSMTANVAAATTVR
jgi:tRNA (cytosine38-C5)-methyltransferase